MEIRELLEQVRAGGISLEEAERELKDLPYKDLGYAKLDYHRKLRSGFPETVFCQGKPDACLGGIFKELYERNGEVMGTRADQHQYELVKTVLPQAVYDPVSRIIKAEREEKERIGCIAVLTGGTADIPVAEEAAQTAEFFGSFVERIYDVGVAGIHRLLSPEGAVSESKLRGGCGRDGGGPGNGSGGPGGKPGDCGAYLGGLRGQFSRAFSARC